MTMMSNLSDDAINLSLSSLSYSSKDKPQAKEFTRNSRLWFRLDQKELTERKQAVAKKQLIHVDKEVEDRLPSFKKVIPTKVQEATTNIREFLLKEIAPITLGINPGVEQAQSVIQRGLEIELDGSVAPILNAMVKKAVSLKLAQYVARQFSLDDPLVLMPQKAYDPNKELTDQLSKSQQDLRAWFAEEFSKIHQDVKAMRREKKEN